MHCSYVFFALSDWNDSYVMVYALITSDRFNIKILLHQYRNYDSVDETVLTPLGLGPNCFK